MGETKEIVFQTIIRQCSRLLLWAGAAFFLVGDAFLYEIKHVNFYVSTGIGILGGVLLMVLGAAIATMEKSRRSVRPKD